MVLGFESQGFMLALEPQTPVFFTFSLFFRQGLVLGGNSPISTSQVAGITGRSHHNQL
jgi:hypothetical protein